MASYAHPVTERFVRAHVATAKLTHAAALQHLRNCKLPYERGRPGDLTHFKPQSDLKQLLISRTNGRRSTTAAAQPLLPCPRIMQMPVVLAEKGGERNSGPDIRCIGSCTQHKVKPYYIQRVLIRQSLANHINSWLARALHSPQGSNLPCW